LWNRWISFCVHREPLGLRQRPWKLVTRRPSGTRDAGGLSNAKLYNLAEDLGEKNNLAAKYPDKVREIMSLLNQVRENGRSRP
jgi:hypothetical protein